MTAIPDAFFERMQALLGEEFPAFLEAFNQPPVSGLRVNTLKLLPQEFKSISPIELVPVPWCASGFQTLNEEKAGSPGKHPYHAAGLYYIQEPSAMAVVEALNPQPGDRVLDLAAAPGGKATHLAARLQGQGVLVANEIHPRRVWILAENLERWGARNVAITNETPGRLAGRLAGYFDKVLVDAPCSGEGLFRRQPEARSEWSPEHVEGCAVRQATILESAARLVRPGGHLAYATCTFTAQENEAQIARFLETHPDFELVSIPENAGFQPGLPEWAGRSAPQALKHTIRLWPHRLPGEGHFIALLARREGAEKTFSRARKPEKAPVRSRELFSKFAQENLVSFQVDILPTQFGSYLYNVPTGMPDFGNLNVIHPGWWLGSVRKGRFEPAHSLAIGLKASQSNRRLDLSSGEPARVRAYLRRESLETGSQGKGWTLVTVDGFPLGWGKWVGDVLKNYYPRGLRWP
jgi:NOL1/NOP2/sun family putative RNA methylase